MEWLEGQQVYVDEGGKTTHMIIKNGHQGPQSYVAILQDEGDILL